MSDFMLIDAKAPATLEAVVEALTRLSTFSEAEILKLVTAGKLKDVFPFKTSRNHPLPPDFVDKRDLVKASALPMNRQQRLGLLKSSVPPTRPDLERLMVEAKPAARSEITDRLDLARAYMDLGDPEGARSILEDVVRDESAWPKAGRVGNTSSRHTASDAAPTLQRKKAHSTSE